MGTTRVTIVGGGISGLAAAWHLRQGHPDLDLMVLDSSDAPGGKLRRAEMAGVAIDVGAESILARRPEGTDLARAVGLTDRLTHPATMSASIWSRGVLHPMPAGTLMGVPSNPAAALGVLDAEEIAFAEGERDRPLAATLGDLPVGEFVSARVGSAVVDRQVEPLLGGVYAGDAHQLSLGDHAPAVGGCDRGGVGDRGGRTRGLDGFPQRHAGVRRGRRRSRSARRRAGEKPSGTGCSGHVADCRS